MYHCQSKLSTTDVFPIGGLSALCVIYYFVLLQHNYDHKRISIQVI